MKFVTTYDKSNDVGTIIDENLPSLCQEQYSEGADINNLIAKFGLVGMMSSYDPSKLPKFDVDYSEIDIDPIEAFNLAKDAKDLIAKLPGEIQTACNGDLGNVVAFFEDSSNQPIIDKYYKKHKPAPESASEE